MFGRLSCHGCGKRSKWAKGTREFQCDNCAYANYFDSKGEPVDPPHGVANPHTQPALVQKAFRTFTQPQDSEAPTRGDGIFCGRCLNNQRFYTEAVSNYLPDEDHPRYQEFEDKLDEFKADMEKKYPLLCKTCAPRVQQKIHKADYYGKSQQIATDMIATRKRGRWSPVGQRDNWGKFRMRVLLTLLGLVVYASLLIQIAWHLSGIAATLLTPQAVDEFIAPDLGVGATYKGCAAQYKSLYFDMACHQAFSTLIPLTILINLCMIWHNHGLKDWYNGTYRMGAINGQAEHFRLQVLLLIVRSIGWYKLSDPWFLADLSVYQQCAAHGFMIVFMLLAQRLSERPIWAEKWKMKGKMMPRPDEIDVFSATAGPAEEQYQRQASSKPPLKLFPQDSKPFPIERLVGLAPNPRGYSRLNLSTDPPPSPPDSESPTREDAMDIDWQAQRPKIKSTFNYGSTQGLGWTGVRNELFSIEDTARAEASRKQKEQEERSKLKYQPPVDPSPFRGRLPQAPMSMERKLRNPTNQVQFKKQPLSKQQDFMKQMRDGVENHRYFTKPKREERESKSDTRSALDFDEDFSPVKNRTRNHLAQDETTTAKSRTKGSLDLHDSGWRLPSDYLTATGLEDLFAGKGFSIDDATDCNVVAEQKRPIPLPPSWLIVVGVFGMIGAVAWNLQPLRHALCHWLIRQLRLEDVQV